MIVLKFLKLSVVIAVTELIHSGQAQKDLVEIKPTPPYHIYDGQPIIPTATTFPAQFKISFDEINLVGGKLLSRNNGTWYYDWTNQRARFEHGQGQTNAFCGNQGLSPKDPKAPCSLIFTPDKKVFVYFSESYTCCYLCGNKQGCTILKRDWAKIGSKLINMEVIDGHKCFGYGKAETEAFDVLYSDIGGDMCRYHQVHQQGTLIRNLTFYRDSFELGPQPDYLFDVPDQCHRTCLHPLDPPPLTFFTPWH